MTWLPQAVLGIDFGAWQPLVVALLTTLTSTVHHTAAAARVGKLPLLLFLATLAMVGCSRPTPAPTPTPIAVGPASDFRAIIAEAPRDFVNWPAAQQEIRTSPKVRDYCALRCAKGTDGKTPDFRIWVDGSDVSKSSPELQALWAQRGTKFPALVMSAFGKTRVQPLPDDVTGALAVLQRTAEPGVKTVAPELVISDLNFQQFLDPPEINGERRAFGRIPRNFAAVPYGQLAGTKPFDLPKIPREQWPALIKQMEATGLLSEMLLAAGIPSLDQDGTNYCWANAVTGAVEAIRCLMGEPYVKLSPASVAAPLTGFRNVGGWGGMALHSIAQDGVASTDYWPANAISRKYDTAASRANRAQHKVVDWYDIPPRDFDAVMTLLLHRIPVCVGLNWWHHEVTLYDPIYLGKDKFGRDTFGVRARNSWTDQYGIKGFFVLTEGRATPDDAVSPILSSPSFSRPVKAVSFHPTPARATQPHVADTRTCAPATPGCKEGEVCKAPATPAAAFAPTVARRRFTLFRVRR